MNFSFNCSSFDNCGSIRPFDISGLIGTLLNLPYPSQVLASSPDCSFVDFPKFKDSKGICGEESSTSSSSSFNLKDPENISDLADFILVLGPDKSFSSSSKLSKSFISMSDDNPPPPPDDFFLSFINNSIPAPKLDERLFPKLTSSMLLSPNELISIISGPLIMF